MGRKETFGVGDAVFCDGACVGWSVGGVSTITWLLTGVEVITATGAACAGANPWGVGVLYLPHKSGFAPQEASRMDSSENRMIVFFIF